MKLRIKGDSIRLRLTQPELSQFGKTGRVDEVTCFPNGRLIYALQASDAAPDLTARFEGNTVTVMMPASWVSEWIHTEQVGFEGTQHLDEGRELYLLVEKDFQCLHKRPDEEDAFPHPLVAGGEAVQE